MSKELSIIYLARLIPIEGVHQPFVLGGMDFLRDVRDGKDVKVGPRVVVVGGGDVSIDVATTALRQGAKDVVLTSRTSRRDMTAGKKDIELAVDRSQLRRSMMPERSAEEVVGKGNYIQIEEGLTDEMALNKTHRCLRCDVSIGCGQCMAACSDMGVEALRMGDTKADRPHVKLQHNIS